MPTTDTGSVLDLSGLDEQRRLAFYGALFALAAADDTIDERESDQILESLDLDGLSEESRQKALAFSISPPSLETCLGLFKDADERYRLGLMVNLVDVALADEEIDHGEPASLELARRALGVTEEQVAAMHTYVYQQRREARKQDGLLRRPLECPPELSC